MSMSYIDHTIGAYLRRNILIPFYWKYVKYRVYNTNGFILQLGGGKIVNYIG
jgi:hypothetical protein